MQKYLLKSFLNYALKSVGEVINTFGRLFAFGQFCRFGAVRSKNIHYWLIYCKKASRNFRQITLNNHFLNFVVL